MKRIKFIALLLAFSVILTPLALCERPVRLKKMFSELTRPRLTSLRKLELVNKYKGEIVKGVGRVKDVVKSYGIEGEAMVYLKKHYRGKEYEIVLVIPEESAEKIKKGMSLTFEGNFAGMTYHTLRFKNVDLIAKPWWYF